MFNIKILIFFVCIFANFNNIQTFYYDGISDDSFVKIGENYYFIGANEQVNWFKAAHLCRSLGAGLATIESQVELDAITSYLLTEDFKDSERFSTSFNDLGKEGSFHSFSTGEPMTFAKWSAGQPDNARGIEHCVQLWKQRGKYLMNDVPCSNEYNYICQR